MQKIIAYSCAARAHAAIRVYGLGRITLRCKTIRGRVGMGAGWLGLAGGVWLLDRVKISHPTKPHPTQQKTYSRAHISWDKTKGHATHGYSKNRIARKNRITR